jgi:hypothetical protein
MSPRAVSARSRAHFFLLTILAWLAGAASAQDPANPRLPRRLVVEAIEPVVVEEPDELFDSSRPGEFAAVIVLCGKPGAAPPAGGLAGLPGGSGAEETPGDWLQHQQDELRQIAVQRALDRGLPPDSPPDVRVQREPNDGAGRRRIADLTKTGHGVDVRRDRDGGGPAECWAVLLTRYAPPPQARLGGIVKRARLDFAPRMTAQGSVELHATSRIEIEPEAPPRGADAQTWARELARARRVAAMEAGWLRARLNLLRLRLPKAAAAAFANGQAFALERSAPLWGREHAITLRMRGKATPIVDAPLGRAERVTADNWRQRLAGGWRITIAHARYGRIDGWMYLDARDHVLEVATGYPINSDLVLLPFAGVMEEIKPVGPPDQRWAFEDGALVLQVRQPQGRLELTPALDGTSLAGTWATWEQAGRVFHPTTCERTKPVLESAVAIRNGSDKPPRVLERIREKQPRVGVTLRLTGTDLPRGPDAFLDSGHSRRDYEPVLEFDDPAVTVEGWLGTSHGDRMLVHLEVRNGFLEGPRRLRVDGAAIDVDLRAQLGGADWPPSDRQPELLRVGILDPTDGGGDRFRLAAEYSERPQAETIQGKVWIERRGQVVRRLPPEATQLRRVAPYLPTYLGYVFLDGTAASGERPRNPPDWRLTEGDVIAFELDGKVARLVPQLREPDADVPLLAPFVEAFELFDPEHPQAREKQWTGATDEVALLARYTSAPGDSEQPVRLSIRRGREIVYRFPAEKTNVLRVADGADSGRVFRRVVRLGPPTKHPVEDPASGQKTPGYEACDGDVLVAIAAGGQRELVLRVPPVRGAQLTGAPLPRRPRTEIVAIEVLRRPGGVPPGLVKPEPPPNVDRWLLFALVDDVNRTQAGPYRLGSPDARIAYRELYRARGLAEAGRQPGSLAYEGYALALAGLGFEQRLAMAHMAGVVIVAETPRGTLPGFRSLIVEDAERQWLLDPGTVDGELRIVRDATPQFGGYERVREVFLHDRLFVELRLQQEIAPDVLGVSILCNGKPWTFAGRPEVPARRVAGDRTLYRTGPIHLLFAALPEPAPGDDGHQHPVKPGDVLVATPAERLFPVPPAHRVQVYGTPADIHFPDFGDASWRHALAVASAVRREHGLDETDFGVDGHAAMLLLRWQFLQMAVEQQREVRLILANPQLVLGYHDVLGPALAAIRAGRKPAPNGPLGPILVPAEKAPSTNPLASLEVDVPGGGTLPLLEALDPVWLEREFQVLAAPANLLESRIARRDTWLTQVMRRVLVTQIGWIDEAMRTVREIHDHDLEALAHLTGHAFLPVVETLRPRLLKPVDRRAPDGRSWRALVPDVEARVTVNQVGARLFELVSRKQAARKRFEAAIALTAAVAMSPYGLLARVTLARVAALAAAGGADVGLAIADVAGWHDHEAELQFARNALPVLGSDRFDLARASKRSAWVPYCTLAMSLLFFRCDVGDLAKGLRVSRALPLADEIAQALLETGANGMRQLTPAEARAFLLALEDARLQQATGGQLAGAHERVLKASQHLEAQQDLLRLQHGSLELALARTQAATALDPEAVEAAAQGAQEAIARLTTRGFDALSSLSAVERESLQIVFVDARLASGSGRALSAFQRAVLELEADLAAQAARKGIDLANQPLLASRLLDLGDAAAGLPRAALPPAPVLRPAPGMPAGYSLGAYRGGGSFAEVYDLLHEGLPTGRVIKLIRAPDFDPTPLAGILERMQRCAGLLAEHPEIAQLACREYRMAGEVAVVVQDVLPDGAKLFQELTGAERLEAKVALMGLHKQMVDAKLAWLDGHPGNVYFFRDGTKLRAGVLDADLLVREGTPIGNDMLAARVLDLERGGQFCNVNSIDDLPLAGSPSEQLRRFEDQVRRDATEVASITVSAERLTLAYFEAFGFIRFERATADQIRQSGGAFRGRFVDGSIPLAVVRHHFGDLQSQVTYGNRLLRGAWSPVGSARRRAA